MSFHPGGGISEGRSADRPRPSSGAARSPLWAVLLWAVLLRAVSPRAVSSTVRRWPKLTASSGAANATAHQEVCSVRPDVTSVRKSVVLMRAVHARNGSPKTGLSLEQIAAHCVAGAGHPPDCK